MSTHFNAEHQRVCAETDILESCMIPADLKLTLKPIVKKHVVTYDHTPVNHLPELPAILFDWDTRFNCLL